MPDFLCSRRHLAAVLLLATTSFCFAGYEAPNPLYAPPVPYYNGAVGVGAALRMNLHNIISAGFVARSYGDARYAFDLLDQDPANSNNILLVYNRASVDAAWDGGVTYNREHVWPKYWLNLTSSQVGNSYRGAASDLFELRPSNPSINSSRNDNPYGSLSSSGAYAKNGSYWFPGDADKGDLARSLFYMATRYYDGSTTLSINNLQLVNGSPTQRYTMGDLASLLRWHYTDGVDNFERRRNQMIYSSTDNPQYYQGNRNPYIDHPEYVWAVFGDGQNDSKLFVSATAPADGGSSQAVSLGRIMLGGAFGAATVTLHKTGADPTTCDITLSSTATCSQAGAGQGIDYGVVNRALTVGLNASTAATGIKTGTVTINNTDLTNQGAGTGALDADDVITITGSVLARRAITAPAAAAFGRVIVGSIVTAPFTLSTAGDDDHYTRVQVAGTAGADANGVSITGSTTLFDAGSDQGSRAFSATFSSVGQKSGSHALSVTSAENGGAGLSGEGTYSPLNVGYSATVLAHAAASFNNAALQTNAQLDLGVLLLNAGPSTADLSLFNFTAAPAFTAALKLDALSGAGATSQLSASLPLGQIAPGDAATLTATFTPSAVGRFSSTYTIAASDEPLPGASAPGAQQLRLTLTGRVLANPTWKADADGLWSASDNWYGGAPSGAGAAATLGDFGSRPRTITLTQPVTLGSLTFDNSASYRLQGDASLTFRTASAPATLTVASGVHTLALPLDPSPALTIDIVRMDAALTCLLPLDAPESALTKRGSGLLTLTSPRLASLTVEEGRLQINATADHPASIGIVSVSGANGQQLLSTSGAVALLQGPLYLRNGAESAAVRQLLNAGQHASAGILSGVAGRVVGAITGAQWRTLHPQELWNGGQPVDNEWLLTLAVTGDADLDGRITLSDYAQLDAAFLLHLSEPTWVNGDFNYDGHLDYQDYALLDASFLDQQGSFAQPLIVQHLTSFGPAYQGYLQTLLQDASPVPEPASLTLLGTLLTLSCTVRRRI